VDKHKTKMNTMHMHGAVTPTDQGIIDLEIPPQVIRKRLISLAKKIVDIDGGDIGTDVPIVSRTVRVLFEQKI